MINAARGIQVDGLSPTSNLPFRRTCAETGYPSREVPLHQCRERYPQISERVSRAELRPRPQSLDQATCALLDRGHGIQDYVLPESAAYELNSCRQVFGEVHRHETGR